MSERDVFKILNSLKVSKANGPDGIGNVVLKSCARSLLEPVSFLVNKSLNDGLFPQSWKTANFTPCLKRVTDEILKTTNRPVSLLSCTSKVLERVVFNKLYNHCIDNNLLSYRNSGFKKKDGPMNRLVYSVDKIHKGFGNEQGIAMVFT